MGRAIDMENDIYNLKIKISTLENTIRGMVLKLDEIDEAIFEDEEVVQEIVEEKKEKKDGKKANNKGSSSDSKGSDAKNGDSKSKNDGDGNSSK
jgi:hypothetical protein